MATIAIWTSGSALNAANTIQVVGQNVGTVQIVPSGTVTGGVVSFEQSPDGVSWSALNMDNQGAAGQATSALADANSSWQVGISAYQIRARLSTVVAGSGSVSVTVGSSSSGGGGPSPTGALLAANNLDDVASPSTSLTNIGGAPLASPTFTGTPAAPTNGTPTDNTTQIATDAFVQSAITTGPHAFTDAVTTTGNSLLLAATTITSGALWSLTQTTSTFTGTGLLMNFATGYVGNFVNFEVNGVSKFSVNQNGGVTIAGGLTATASIAAAAAATTGELPKLNQITAYLTITSGALPTVALVSGTGAQVSTTRRVMTYTPVTLTPTSGAAATCAIAISSDNTTYTTVGTETVPAGTALDSFVRVIAVEVPQSWYIKLTVTNGSIGTTTYA